MTTKPVPETDRRAPLSRDRVLDAALQLIEENGLDALSMHKLGAQLGVRGMSLYNHVTNKSDLLDGVVELLWSTVESAVDPSSGWRYGVRSYAHAVRDVIRRHPNAAPLLTTQHVMPAPALRLVRAQIATAIEEGIPEERAYDLLRTISSYTLGSAFVDVGWGFGASGCAPTVGDLLRPGVPDELVGVAEVFCGQSDPDAQFELGLELMLRG